MDFVEMRFPVFRAGTHTDSAGKAKTWTEEDLDRMVSSYDPAGHEAPLVIGGLGAAHGGLFDGLVDDVRLSDAALKNEELLFTSPSTGEHTMGFWKFENSPNPYADSSGHSHDISSAKQKDARKDPRFAALVDFCHVLLNSNEFLYLD